MRLCPKSNEDIAPDTHQKWAIKLSLIHDQLKEIEFNDISLSSYGSHYYKNVFDIIKNFERLKVEVVTNGDVLKKITRFILS